jgi:hypothetical protein
MSNMFFVQNSNQVSSSSGFAFTKHQEPEIFILSSKPSSNAYYQDLISNYKHRDESIDKLRILLEQKQKKKYYFTLRLNSSNFEYDLLFNKINNDLIFLNEGLKSKKLNQLDAIRNLEQDWDDEGADCFLSNHINFVEKIILSFDFYPIVSPSRRKSIVLEYSSGSNKLLFEVFENTFDYYEKKISQNGEKNTKNGRKLSNDLNAIKYFVEAFINESV